MSNEETKKKRGRPPKPKVKRDHVNFLAPDGFLEELRELSKLENETMTEYMIKSIRNRGNMTRLAKSQGMSGADELINGGPINDKEELEVYPDEDYMDYEYDEDDLEEDWR